MIESSRWISRTLKPKVVPYGIPPSSSSNFAVSLPTDFGVPGFPCHPACAVLWIFLIKGGGWVGGGSFQLDSLILRVNKNIWKKTHICLNFLGLKLTDSKKNTKSLIVCMICMSLSSPLLLLQGGPEQQSRPCFGGLQWFHWGGSRSSLYQSRPFLWLRDLGSGMVFLSHL